MAFFSFMLISIPTVIELLRVNRDFTTTERRKSKIESFTAAIFLFKMTGTKKNSVYRKKREGQAFSGSQRYVKRRESNAAGG